MGSADLVILAHEGNPRENSVEVFEQLDGVPALVPDKPPEGGRPTPPADDLSISATELDCTVSDTVTLTVTGGRPPFTYSATVGTVSSTGTRTAELTAPTNAGSAESGTAYKKVTHHCANSGFPRCSVQEFGCADQSLTVCVENVSSPGCSWTCLCGNCTACADDFLMFKTNPATSCCGITVTFGSGCEGLAAGYSDICDVRTAGQIAANCNPCAIEMYGGSVVTVTDALGAQAFVTVINVGDFLEGEGG